MKTLIKNATLVNEGKTNKGCLLIENEIIRRIATDANELAEYEPFDHVVDAEGAFLLPGVIDDHVHFREPGLTHKADMESESRAAAAGGVTSIMDMPNVSPLTTDLETLEAKYALGQEKCRINYSFFFGATNNNTHLLQHLDPKSVCGVKLFMGSRTGNMLVDRQEALLRVFGESPMLIMTHCEDTERILDNQKRLRDLYGEDPDVKYHPELRDTEACYRSSELAVQMAEKTGARLHIAHITTAKELELLEAKPLCTPGTDHVQKNITAEACVAHLWFCNRDYARLGTRIKCNPAIKTEVDRDALRKAITNGKVDVVGTDHAPHLLNEKQGGCIKAVSGMPMIQFSLVSMLQMSNQGLWTPADVVQQMCHAPAQLFGIQKRGFLREGYQADLVLVRPTAPWQLCTNDVLSKCGWSPLEGESFEWKVEKTYCNGHLVFDQGRIDDGYRGQRLLFNR